MMNRWSTQAYQAVFSAQQSRKLCYYGLRPGSIGVSYVRVLQRPGGLTYLGHVWEVARRGDSSGRPGTVQLRDCRHGRELCPRRVETYEPVGCCSCGSVYVARAVASRARWSRGAGRFRTRRDRRGRPLRADGDGGCRAGGCPRIK